MNGNTLLIAMLAQMIFETCSSVDNHFKKMEKMGQIPQSLMWIHFISHGLIIIHVLIVICYWYPYIITFLILFVAQLAFLFIIMLAMCPFACCCPAKIMEKFVFFTHMPKKIVC